eukprot:1193378-Prorocentrum_minimum.AAC.1
MDHKVGSGGGQEGVRRGSAWGQKGPPAARPPSARPCTGFTHWLGDVSSQGCVMLSPPSA